jgi:hypothetical protein
MSVIRCTVILAVVLAALPGCTTWEGGVPGFLRNRLKDALDVADLGVTVTPTPQFSFYAALLSVGPGGYGRVDGTFYGVGGGDIGAMRIHYRHYGFLVYGREETGWGDGFLWTFGGFDVNNPATMNIQGVGIGGILLGPYGRPGGRPT